MVTSEATLGSSQLAENPNPVEDRQENESQSNQCDDTMAGSEVLSSKKVIHTFCTSRTYVFMQIMNNNSSFFFLIQAIK